MTQSAQIKLSRSPWNAVLAAFIGFCSLSARAQITSTGNLEKLRQETIYQVKAKLAPLLGRYCKEACEITNVEIEMEDQVPDSEDIGFEGVMGNNNQTTLVVGRVAVDIQVDDRVSVSNRERLQVILNNNLRSFGPSTQVRWNPVQVPQIGQSEAVDEELKRSTQLRVWNAIARVLETYCPKECVISRVNVDGRSITPDQASDVNPKEIVRDKAGRGVMRIDNVDAEISIDEKMPESERAKIANLIKAKTRFVEPFNLDVTVTDFPEPYSNKREREAAASSDPFGLERLRETLKIFRELAGTKEIISKESVTSNNSNTNSNSESVRSSESKSASSLQEMKSSAVNTELNKSESSLATSSQQNSSSQEGAGAISPLQYGLFIGGFLLLAGIIIAMIMRFAGANRDAKVMMAAGPMAYGQPAGGMAFEGAAAAGGGEGNAGAGAAAGGIQAVKRDMLLKLKRDELKDELVSVFMDVPKVAKETFSRILQDEGVEEASKYVQIFGQMVVFELMDDPNLQRDLYALSEYYQKTSFNFTLDEEISLLMALRTRVTANEIRLLSRKQMDKFDFLQKLDSGQIYNLIREEKPQLQSIVLTQLDHKRRRAVFEMYEGDSKVGLMRELCRADAIPKDYLHNVARALHKKVQARPEFDTENLRSSDILLDLLEKSGIEDQRALMRDLVKTNAEAARGIKLKLVTIEILPFLKDGHLLELTLGMERQDLVAFLAGTREHIRDLLLAKAPEELAQSWVEELEHIHGVDEQAYRLTELKMLARVRQLANNGAINLLDINEVVFADNSQSIDAARENVPGAFSRASLVA